MYVDYGLVWKASRKSASRKQENEDDAFDALERSHIKVDICAASFLRLSSLFNKFIEHTLNNFVVC